jgi:5-hydroxyisourate hydrolase-like protein (transthyretin family)
MFGKVLGFLFLSLPTIGFACSCVSGGDASACTLLKATEVVFLGRVVQDTGTSDLGERPGRLIVEDALHGLPKDLQEVQVDTMARTSCYMPLTMGERYVIYGSRDKSEPNLIHYHACSYSFRLRGNELLYDALRLAEDGGPSTLVGVLRKEIGKYETQPAPGGIRVIAESQGQRHETQTRADGYFVFHSIAPGGWRVRVDSPGVIQVQGYDSPEGSITVPARSCQVQSIRVVSAGRISGVIVDSSGKPVQRVPVQAFALDDKGRIDTKAFREGTTDSEGRYTVSPLPSRSYAIGVNAEKYSDRLAFPPIFYPSSANPDGATVISLGDGEEKSGIDLQLRPARRPATLVIHALMEDGTPATGSLAGIEDLAGTQRAYSVENKADSNGILKVQLWEGESYKIESHRTEIVNRNIRQWRGTAGPVTLNGNETVIEVTLSLIERK